MFLPTCSTLFNYKSSLILNEFTKCASAMSFSKLFDGVTILLRRKFVLGSFPIVLSRELNRMSSVCSTLPRYFDNYPTSSIQSNHFSLASCETHCLNLFIDRSSPVDFKSILLSFPLSNPSKTYPWD